MLPTSSIGGLISGLDTNSIIEQLVELQRQPILRLEDRRVELQQKDAAWQSINTKLSAFLSELESLDHPADWLGKVAATSSDPEVVAATAGAGATTGSLTFTVDQLARSHQLASTDTLTSGDDTVGAGTLTLTVDGVDHEVTTTASTTLSQLAAQIDALDAGVSASVLQVDDTTARLVVTADETGTANQFTVTATQAGLSSGFDVVQAAQDAQITVGSGAGAITVTRSSNTVTDLMEGVTLDLQATGGPVTITVDRDIDAAVEQVRGAVDALNAVLSTLDQATAYNSESDTAGPLAGDIFARRLGFDLRAIVSDSLGGADGAFTHAAAVGIELTSEGLVTLNEDALRDALASDWDSVTGLFAKTATATDSRVSYVGSEPQTLDGIYTVTITGAASQASVTGTAYANPGSDVSFTITSGSTDANVTIAAGDDLATAITKINDALDAAGIDTIEASDEGGAIRLRETRYGSGISFSVMANPFGLDGTHTGTDVAGTIGGQVATGSGQVLTATAGDPDGLSLRITAIQSEVDGAGGSLDLGTVNLVTGLAAQLEDYTDDATSSGGLVSRARDLWAAQIDTIDDRIVQLEDRLETYRSRLIAQFTAMEESLNRLNGWATGLLAQLPDQPSA